MAVFKDVNAIGKDGRNTFQNYNFRGIEQVYEYFHPLLAKHGIYTVQRSGMHRSEVITSHNKSGDEKTQVSVCVDIKIDFICSDTGELVTASGFGEGIDTSDKATNKATSGAVKYIYFNTFCVPVNANNVDDGDRHHEPRNNADKTKGMLHKRIEGVMITKEFTAKLQEQSELLTAQRETLAGLTDEKNKATLELEIQQIEGDIEWRLDILAHVVTEDIERQIDDYNNKITAQYIYKYSIEDVIEDVVKATSLNGKYHDIKATKKGLVIT